MAPNPYSWTGGGDGNSNAGNWAGNGTAGTNPYGWAGQQSAGNPYGWANPNGTAEANPVDNRTDRDKFVWTELRAKGGNWAGKPSKPSPYTFINPVAHNRLETIAESKGRVWASLVNCTKYLPSPGVTQAITEGQHVWNFLANPQSIDVSRQAIWIEQPTLGNNATMLNYGHTQGAEITLNDMLLPVVCPAKNLQRYLDDLQKLMVAPRTQLARTTPNNPLNSDYRAPYLAFVWGTNVRYPVVIKSIKYTETVWQNGMPVYVKLSITLQEIPQPLPPNRKSFSGQDLDAKGNRNSRYDQQTDEIEDVFQVKTKDDPLWFLNADNVKTAARIGYRRAKQQLGGRVINDVQDRVDKFGGQVEQWKRANERFLRDVTR